MAKKSESQHKRGDSAPKKGPSKDKVQSDLTEKVLHINRCSKVVKGGRKFSFSALIIVGDHKGSVGWGFGKANELTDAIRKGGEDARKNMIRVPMIGSTIPQEICEKWDGGRLLLKPAPPGSGVIAGSKTRSILELAGIENVVAKNMGGNNPINQVKVCFLALSKLMMPEAINKLRGQE